MIHFQLSSLKTTLPNTFVSSNCDCKQMNPTVLLKLEDTDGHQGYGEACPECNTSGENLLTIRKDLNKISWRISFFQAESFDTVWTFIQELEHCKIGASTRCLLEIALIDLWANREGANLPDFFQLQNDQPLRYSLVLPLMSAQSLKQLVETLPAFQPPSIKIKLDRNLEENLKRIEVLQSVYNCPIRVDLNGSWSFGLARQIIPILIKKGITSFEQPLAKENFSGMSKLLKCFRSKIQLVADESLTNYADAKELIKREAVNVFNINLSRVGGIGQALAIYKLAKEHGIPCQLGAHNGETRLLTRLGLLLASMPEVQLQATECCLGTWLSTKGLATNFILLNRQGKVDVQKAFPSIGLGSDLKRMPVFWEQLMAA